MSCHSSASRLHKKLLASVSFLRLSSLSYSLPSFSLGYRRRFFPPTRLVTKFETPDASVVKRASQPRIPTTGFSPALSHHGLTPKEERGVSPSPHFHIVTLGRDQEFFSARVSHEGITPESPHRTGQASLLASGSTDTARGLVVSQAPLELIGGQPWWVCCSHKSTESSHVLRCPATSVASYRARAEETSKKNTFVRRRNLAERRRRKNHFRFWFLPSVRLWRCDLAAMRGEGSGQGSLMDHPARCFWQHSQISSRNYDQRSEL